MDWCGQEVNIGIKAVGGGKKEDVTDEGTYCILKLFCYCHDRSWNIK